jgi:hypothetical protein
MDRRSSTLSARGLVTSTIEKIAVLISSPNQTRRS